MASVKEFEPYVLECKSKLNVLTSNLTDSYGVSWSKNNCLEERMEQKSSESYGGAHEQNINMLYQNYICVNDTVAGKGKARVNTWFLYE